jgi:hypothetical protein
MTAGFAKAQQAPMVTYKTDLFQYWHLKGEAPLVSKLGRRK